MKSPQPEESLLRKIETTEDTGPQSEHWHKRVKVEILNLKVLLNHYKENDLTWFTLKPDNRQNFQVWKGQLILGEICFDYRVVLAREYPRAFPRAFVEEDMLEYTKKDIYQASTFSSNEEKTFVMIDYDTHDINWKPELTIAHFMLRRVRIWFATIRKDFDKLNGE